MTSPLPQRQTFTAEQYNVLVTGGRAITEAAELMRDRPEHHRTTQDDHDGVDTLQGIVNVLGHILDTMEIKLEEERDAWELAGAPLDVHGRGDAPDDGS